MNNEQFRRLLLDNSSKSSSKDNRSTPSEASPKQDVGRPGDTPRALLGSRMRSSIPMTPRSVTGVDFARQLAEHRRESGQPPTKRFRSSAAPKGSKLATGYQDRAAKLREAQEDETGNDIEKRVQALEEMVKLGQVDQATFEKIRSELGVGGDLQSTHMVKGLDRELLKRIRAGEDVSKGPEKPPAQSEETAGPAEDVDEEFDRLMEEKAQDVLSLAPKEKKQKKGSMAPPPAPVQKKTRDEILKELKASRAAAASQPPEPALGAKFKKFGESKVEKKRFIEQDENGGRREVLLITDAEGKTKRKVRWLDKPGESNGASGLLVPDKDAKPLGMEVPAEFASKTSAPLEDEDGDIFEGVGVDYNPLGPEDDSSSDSDENGEVNETRVSATEKAPVNEKEAQLPVATSRPRNYFSTDEPAESDDRSTPLTKDPTILAALKRAAALRQASPSAEAATGDEDVEPDTLLRRKKFLEEARRREALDAMDMDFGFGGSRNEDDEDDEPVQFEDEKGKKRKRGPKKKKGDKDSAADVMRVLEGRQKG